MNAKRKAVIIGGNGNLGQAVAAELTKTGFEIDPLWIGNEHPDATLESSYSTLPSKIDVAIYLAGVNHVSPLHELSSANWDRVINVNLRGAFLFAKHAFASLKACPGSLFLTVSSIMATHPYPNRTAYASAKAALEGLTRALAVEWGPYGINTHCLRLGHLSGLMKSTPSDPRLLDAVKEKTPGHRLLDANDVASYISWLASRGAASLTGTVIDFDPGYTLNRWPIA